MTDYEPLILAAIKSKPGLTSGELNEAVHAKSGKRSNAPIRAVRDRLLAEGRVSLKKEHANGHTSWTYHWFLA